MNKYWYIYGAGGLGAETVDILQDALSVSVRQTYSISFLEDDPKRDILNGYPVYRLHECRPGSNVTVAVGEPLHRSKMAARAQEFGLELASVISSNAYVSPSAEIGAGVIIAPFCSVQAKARIEGNVAINTMAIIGHNVFVQKNAVVSSMVNLGGAVEIGAQSYIGMGALIKEGLKIGTKSIVGMGSIVYRNVPDGMIALGNPARVARRNDDEKVFK